MRLDVTDRKGTELSDEDAAREEARRRAYILLSEGYELGEDRGQWMLAVRDVAGEVLLDLTLREWVGKPLFAGRRQGQAQRPEGGLQPRTGA